VDQDEVIGKGKKFKKNRHGNQMFFLVGEGWSKERLTKTKKVGEAGEGPIVNSPNAHSVWKKRGEKTWAQEGPASRVQLVLRGRVGSWKSKGGGLEGGRRSTKGCDQMTGRHGWEIPNKGPVF